MRKSVSSSSEATKLEGLRVSYEADGWVVG